MSKDEYRQAGIKKMLQRRYQITAAVEGVGPAGTEIKVANKTQGCVLVDTAAGRIRIHHTIVEEIR